MNQNEIFNTLFGGGNISQHWLLELRQNDTVVRLANNNEPVVYDGYTFSVSTFDYVQPNNKGEGGSLEITCFDNDLLLLVDELDDTYSMKIVGVLVGDEVTEINAFKHFYGSVTVGDDGNISFQLGKDDRLDMKFTVQKYDTETNPGNA